MRSFSSKRSLRYFTHWKSSSRHHARLGRHARHERRDAPQSHALAGHALVRVGHERVVATAAVHAAALDASVAVAAAADLARALHDARRSVVGAPSRGTAPGLALRRRPWRRVTDDTERGSARFRRLGQHPQAPRRVDNERQQRSRRVHDCIQRQVRVEWRVCADDRGPCVSIAALAWLFLCLRRTDRSIHDGSTACY